MAGSTTLLPHSVPTTGRMLCCQTCAEQTAQCCDRKQAHGQAMFLQLYQTLRRQRCQQSTCRCCSAGDSACNYHCKVGTALPQDAEHAPTAEATTTLHALQQAGFVAEQAPWLALRRVLREAGARVVPNARLRDLGVRGAPRHDNRNIEAAAYGLPLHFGLPLLVDITMVSPLQANCHPTRGAAATDGVAISNAEQRKRRTYPELVASPEAKLVVVVTRRVGDGAKRRWISCNSWQLQRPGQRLQLCGPLQHVAGSAVCRAFWQWRHRLHLQPRSWDTTLGRQQAGTVLRPAWTW